MILAGDVGGTKTNLALMRPGGEGAVAESVAERTYASRDHAGLAEVVAHFLAEVGRPDDGIDAACFGIAGPVVDQRVTTPNLPWVIEAGELSKQIDVPEVVLLNDLEATGWGIATLGPEQLVALNDVEAHIGSNGALIAAGTGLGEALLMRPQQGAKHVHDFRPVAGEGGHCDFGPRDELEIGLLRFLKERYDRVSYERVISGPGLYNIYQYLRERGEHGHEPPELRAAIEQDDPSAAVSRAALVDGIKLARATLELFVELYGAEAGNVALTVMALGGVYIGGGIAPKLRDVLCDGHFMRGFTAKGRFAAMTKRMPVYLILEPKTALLGAARRAELALGVTL
ncbi:MAG: glucokinase [Myxococcales bacterium]|nr:glucokinase [Myxococcales bacterium]